jgi:hypothetical protein
MPNHRELPRWRYGDVLTNDEPSHPDADHKDRAMFVAWEHTNDYNPTESVCVLIRLSTPFATPVNQLRVLRPYCGWWTDVSP